MISLPFVFFLFGYAILTLFNTASVYLGKWYARKLLETKFLFHSLLKKLPRFKWDKFNFVINLSQHIFLLLYVLSAFLLFSFLSSQNILNLVIFAISILTLFILIDCIARFLAALWPRPTLFFSSLLASFYLFILFPITFPLLMLTKYVHSKMGKKRLKKHLLVKEKLLEIIRDTELSSFLDGDDKKIIGSLITFRDKVAREIMVPRVDMFSLPATTLIRDAGKYFLSEDYSRVPVYRSTQDNIIGVLMYKDILKVHVKKEAEEGKDLLDSPVETILKPVIYAPENKKISQLFQEFKAKQSHLAIIVNEYGGTEGIVTIEDILEELVGEIEDEYDIEEQCYFWKLPNGGWIVDAKMSIIDIDNKLNIKIPHSPEYETIGGYVFHKAGTIPSKGWNIHHDAFTLEILISNERRVEKIRITPVSS